MYIQINEVDLPKIMELGIEVNEFSESDYITRYQLKYINSNDESEAVDGLLELVAAIAKSIHINQLLDFISESDLDNISRFIKMIESKIIITESMRIELRDRVLNYYSSLPYNDSLAKPGIIASAISYKLFISDRQWELSIFWDLIKSGQLIDQRLDDWKWILNDKRSNGVSLSFSLEYINRLFNQIKEVPALDKLFK